jgi:hypothetical protein
MGGAIFDQSIGTWRPRTGLDVATTTTGLPPGMEGDFVRTAEQRGQIAAELEARQQKESFAALSGSEQLSVKVYDLVRAAERVPQNIRKVVTTVWEQANGLIPRINTKFNVALSAAASMAALAACGGALPKSPEPTPTPRIVQTVDVVKPTATATTPFETPTPPAVTKEQLANVLIQQDTYTADVVESWKGDMTPTQLLARKVLKGELGPEDDAAEVRSMSYSMKNAGGFSFDIAASASDQSKMRIGFFSPDGSLQMRDVRAVQEQNGTMSLLMTQEGRTLVIARRSLDGKAFVINPADAPGVIKRIGENSPELSLGKDMIVIESLPTPEPKQPNLDLLAFLFPPQKAKAESPPTPGPTTGNVFSGTVEARASATPLAATVTASPEARATVTGTVATPEPSLTPVPSPDATPTILKEFKRVEGAGETTYILNPKESGGISKISIPNINLKNGETARADFDPQALAGINDIALSALVINERLAAGKSVPNPEEMPALLAALRADIAANKPIPVTLARPQFEDKFVLVPAGVVTLQPQNGAVSVRIVDSDAPPSLPSGCSAVVTGRSISTGSPAHTLACVSGSEIILGVDPTQAGVTYAANNGNRLAVPTEWVSQLSRAAIYLARQGEINERKVKGSDGGNTFGNPNTSVTNLQADWEAFSRNENTSLAIPLALPRYQTFLDRQEGKPVIHAAFVTQ